MAKLTIGEGIPSSWQWVTMVVHDLTIIRQTKKALVYADSEGDTLIFKGKNFKYEDGEFAGGRVTEVVVKSPQGDVYGLATDINLKADGLFDNYPPNFLRVRDVVLAGDDLIIGSKDGDLIFAMEGNDVVKGRKGNDSIYGLEGNDTLTGGPGIDTFNFSLIERTGRDKITDFDVDKEMLVLTGDDFIRIKDGRDTILAFEDGDRIRLMNVKPLEFTADNYYLVEY